MYKLKEKSEFFLLFTHYIFSSHKIIKNYLNNRIFWRFFTPPLNPPTVRGPYILWLSGMVCRNAQIFAKSYKNGVENRTPRSTKRRGFRPLLFVPFLLCVTPPSPSPRLSEKPFDASPHRAKSLEILSRDKR